MGSVMPGDLDCGQYECGSRHRFLVPRPTLENSSIAFLVQSPPLLEEEGNTGSLSLFPYVDDPILFHWPCPRPGLAAHNYPVNLAEIQMWQWTQQWLKRQEPDSRTSLAKSVDPEPVVTALHAHAHPYIVRPFKESIQFEQTIRSLR